MDITLLIGLGFVLVLVLAFLIFLFFASARKKSALAQEKKPAKVLDLKALRAITEDETTSSKELRDALDLVLKNYGVIDRNFDIYMEILFSICLHPNTNKNIILNFDKELRRLNPEFKTEINEALTKGLNSRGV